MRERLSTPEGFVLRAWTERDVPALVVAFTRDWAFAELGLFRKDLSVTPADRGTPQP